MCNSSSSDSSTSSSGGKRPLSSSSLSRVYYASDSPKSSKLVACCPNCEASFSVALPQKQRPLSTPAFSSSSSTALKVSPNSSSSPTPTPADTIGASAYRTSDSKAASQGIAVLTRALQNMDLSSQQALLVELVNNCNTSQLTFLNNIIAPKLKRDFLRDLPLELAHHILSFIDDPQSLARVGQVSRFWHQLIETEDWIWRAQCIKLFGPTSCSSLPSPKSHIAPPTSYLFTTSPTSLDAVSSTLKALSSSNSSNSNSPASQRLSLLSCSTSGPSSASSSSRTSPAWMSARELPGMTSATSASSATGLIVAPTSSDPSSTVTSTVLSSMLLANQSSLSSPVGHGSVGGTSSFSTLPSATKLRSSMTSRLAAASAIASVSTASSSSSSPTLSSTQGLGVMSALSSLEGRTSSAAGKKKATEITPSDIQQEALFGGQQQYQLQMQMQLQQQQQQARQQYRQAISYKAYFKRRYMIDRNWISGQHTLISSMTPETGVVTSLQFDHHHIVVGCDNNRIQIFETTTGRLLRTLKGHVGGVWALEFVKGVGATGEKILVSGGCDREVRVWDMNTGKCRQVMSGHTGTIRCLKLHQLPNNNNKSDDAQGGEHKQQQSQRYLAITGSRDATLRVWDIQTGQNLFLLLGHRDSVRCIDAHGDLLVSGSYDCTARVWSLTTGECLLNLQGHFQQIYSIAFNGEYIITGSLDSTCRLWSPVSGACLATLQGHTQLVGQLQLSEDSLMTGGGDGFMYLWNLKTMECQYRVQAHEQSVTSLCFDAKRIVTGGNDGTVKLWDRQTGKFIRLLTKTDAAIWRVAICEERVVICMPKNGRTATEVMCFDSEAPVLPDGQGSSTSAAPTAATVQLEQPRFWDTERPRTFGDLRI
ncbi:WD40-repeat-containing domain protein [Dissophora ornata]|nr:hypothetical protein BGZ58_007202 [Dissophora ornata]KAI8605558.1 WD40-repeat-containing domain protein [Dissophora ornata]